MVDTSSAANAPTLDELAREFTDFRERSQARIASLEGEIARLTESSSRVPAGGGRPPSRQAPDAATAPVGQDAGPGEAEAPERRHLSRRGAILALGAAAAGGVGMAVASTTMGAQPAGATDGGPVLLGDSNSAAAVTQVINSGTGDGVNVVNLSGGNAVHGIFNSTSATARSSLSGDAGILGETDAIGVQGVAGASDSGDGVQGITSGTGHNGVSGFDVSSAAGSNGVLGRSTSGYGGSFQGGQSPLRLVPAGFSGLPTGTHQPGEFYVDSNGVLSFCYATDEWVRITDGNAPLLIGTNNVDADNDPTQILGGPLAISNLGDAPFQLVPNGESTPPASSNPGEFVVLADGALWYCYAVDDWVQLNNGIVTLPAPVRVIETSSNLGMTGPIRPGGSSAGGAPVYTSSVLTGSNGIPTQALGLVGNLAIAVNVPVGGGGTLNGSGVVAMFPAGASTPVTANINAGAGCFAISNSVTVALGTGADAGKLSLVWYGGGPVQTIDVYFDVAGYIL